MHKTLRTVLLIVGLTFSGYFFGAFFGEKASAQETSLTPDSLTWLAGHRAHTNANGSVIYEAFLGPINGVLTGTALSSSTTAPAYTEYHRFGPNEEGRYGLAVASTRSNMVWNFTPLKSIEAGRITFQSDNGALTITYFSTPGNGVGAYVERIANGQTTRTDYDFKVVE